MDDWTKEPFESELSGWEKYKKKQTLLTKATLDLIAKFPEGATRKDFDDAGIRIAGVEKLMKLKIIKGTQIREPERGPRCYHWLWKINKE
ncbi:unnamed protein product [marine sediment metagenome]|uniref:Uncharacterized protein n=1 Tax=marine sediment metagenome TaxID=412755 RepID=X0TPC3_9ZZZZ